MISNHERQLILQSIIWVKFLSSLQSFLVQLLAFQFIVIANHKLKRPDR